MMRLKTPSSGKTSERPPDGPEDPLGVVPRHALGVEVRETAAGEYHLRKQYPPRPGLLAALRRRLGWKHECFYNLDARGTEFWKMIDGERPLREIASMGASRWDVPEKEACAATIIYVRHLMLRNLLVLEVPERAPEMGDDER